MQYITNDLPLRPLKNREKIQTCEMLKSEKNRKRLLLLNNFFMDTQFNDSHINDLQGDAIKQIFIYAGRVADLHAALTSLQGGLFRRKILQNLATSMTLDQIEEIRKEVGREEIQRHLNLLLEFKLVEGVAVDGS